MRDRKDPEAGFTLIEMVVALGVLSIGVVALLNLTGETVRTAAAVRENVMAGIVAENRMIETVIAAETPEFGSDSGKADMAGRTWRWRRQVQPTQDESMARIEVRVSPADGAGDSAHLTGFRGIGDPS